MRKIIIWICFIVCYVLVWVFWFIAKILIIIWAFFGFFANLFEWMADQIKDWIHEQKRKL
jgi:hypothetical protein